MLAVGTKINTPISTNRYIVRNNHYCNSYNFNNHPGYLVNIGNATNTCLEIPFQMLSRIYQASLENNCIYDATVIRTLYPQQVHNHGCHVHVVGMIFVNLGLVSFNNARNYKVINHPNFDFSK